MLADQKSNSHCFHLTEFCPGLLVIHSLSTDYCFRASVALVGFQVSPHIACLDRSILTLVAFKRFFSSVSFKVSLQMASTNRRIIALVTFERFLSRMSF